MHRPNSSSSSAPDQSAKVFLVGKNAAENQWLKCCPTASSLLCTELETGLDAVLAIPCRRWGCKWCGQRKAFHLACKCEQAKPSRFITLTVDPKRWITPRDAYDGTRRKLSDFAKLIRKSVGSFEYLRVLEVTKKGWPHYHFLARCGYIPQATLSTMWAELTGACIVDVRRVDKGTNVFKYVLKYLCKQTYVPWTSRRVSWSRSFFPKPEETEKRQNPFVNRKRNILHPAAAIAARYSGESITERRPGVWVVEGRTDRISPRVPFTVETGPFKCQKSQVP